MLGFSLYALFGERYLGRLRAGRARTQFRFYNQWLDDVSVRQDISAPINSPLRPVMELTRGSLRMPAMDGNHWRILDTSDAVFDTLLEDIEEAREWIFMEFYILEDLGRVKEVLTALEAARARGVRVFLLLDSVGSNRFLRSKRCRAMRAA